MIRIVLLTLLPLITGILHIRAEYLPVDTPGRQRQIFIFKPLTTILILLLALLAPRPEPPLYQVAIVIALLFSLGGDIFLMLPQDRFLFGLASFLVAHLVYIVAFSLRTPELWTSWGVLPLLLYGAGMTAYLWPGVKRKMRLPVLLYILAILVMAWRGLEQWSQVGGTAALLAFAGTLFFVASDSLLAVNRFRRPFYLAQAFVLSTYYLAQWLIALSI
jgi:uncharacterized membrane protein YhhN